ncbi:hypothetical protein [Microbacterium sp. ZW T5_56]|uniref:hypothetical protein n=1 Tax=Microbacterium sp. ZW T5_56 TaxID=3378081 RepID=UPI0038519440
MTRPAGYLNAKRVLQVIALGLVLGAAVYACAAPSFATVRSDSSGHSTAATRTLLEAQGPGLLLIFAALAALAACPLFLRGTRWSAVSLVVAVVLGAFTILGAMTIGGLFLPAAVASFVAALLPTRVRDHTPIVSEAV